MSDLTVAKAQIALVAFDMYRRFEKADAIYFSTTIEEIYTRATDDKATAEDIVACYEEAQKRVKVSFAHNPVVCRNLALIFDVYDGAMYEDAWANECKREREFREKVLDDMSRKKDEFEELGRAFDRFTAELLSDAENYMDYAEKREL